MNIMGTGSALPKRQVTNDELAEFLDTSDEWIRTRTGIATRRLMTDETLDQLAAEAAHRALENARVSAEAIDFILCSTVQGEWVTPGLGCIVQRDIGAVCPALDLNGACAGFIYALHMADALIASSKAQNVLIVCAEGMSRLVDWKDRSNCVLFGDGAAAVVVGAGEGLLSLRLTTVGGENLLHARAPRGNCPYTAQPMDYEPLKMEGQDVYRFAVSNSAEDIKALLSETGLTADAVDHYLLHQANLRILDAVRARLKVDPSRFEHNIEHTGNTSSASVPILLDELNRAGKLLPGELIALSAFGAGLVTGACLLRWNTNLSPIK